MSFFVYADIGPYSFPRYQRQVVAMAHAVVPVGNPRRRLQEVDGLLSHLERLASGVSNDGWQHLSNDVIASIHSFPLDWTSVMRRMAMACDYIHRAVRGDLPVVDEYFEEDDDTEPDDGMRGW